MIVWINLESVKISVYGESDEILVVEVVCELLFRKLFDILKLYFIKTKKVAKLWQINQILMFKH